jgi:hypothetical protein
MIAAASFIRRAIMLAAGTRGGPYEVVSWLGAGGWARSIARVTRLSTARSPQTLSDELFAWMRKTSGHGEPDEAVAAGSGIGPSRGHGVKCGHPEVASTVRSVCWVRSARDASEGVSSSGRVGRVATAKEIAMEIVQSLPDDCTLEEAAYRIYLRQLVEEAREDFRQGRVFTQEEVEREAAKWLEP